MMPFLMRFSMHRTASCLFLLRGFWIATLTYCAIWPQSVQVSSVQFSHSVVSDSLWPHESQHARPPCPSLTPRVPQTHIHRVSDTIQPSHPRSPSPPAPNPPSIRVFSNESTIRMRWPKYWSFSFSINPSNEHPGLISFRMCILCVN